MINPPVYVDRPVTGWPGYTYAAPTTVPDEQLRLSIMQGDRHVCEVEGWTFGEVEAAADYALGVITAEEAQAHNAPRGGSRMDGPLLEGPQTAPQPHHVVRGPYPGTHPDYELPSEITNLATMAHQVNTARVDDPLWDDPAGLVQRMQEAQLVTGGKHPRLRTRGWQVLMALTLMAVAEAEDAPDPDGPSEGELERIADRVGTPAWKQV